MKRALFIFIALLFCTFNSIADDVRILKRTLQVKPENEYQEIEFNWPVVSGMENQDLQDKINGRLFDFFLNSQTAEPNKVVIKVPKLQDVGVILHYQMLVKYETRCNQNNLLCIEKVRYVFSGGAHGMTDWIYPVFDLSTGKELAIADVLVKNYQGKLEELINKYINRENFFKPTEPVQLDKASAWSITKDAFFVHYPLYELAPYVNGPANVEIPFSAMQDLIDPNGPLSVFLK